ncbi:MAG: PorV/PorQ family protein [Bacteroidota bacterium]|nr:PorV/PorQ family protein [Bacteroidota bacterium]
MIQIIFVGNSKAQLFPNLGGQRTGISSLSFLKNDVNPGAIALSGANTTMKGDAYASQWNPAALTELGNHSFAVSTRLYGLGVNHSFAAANIKIRETDFMAVSVNNLNSGNMEIRNEFQPKGTGQFFSMNAMALGLSYAKALTYKFSLGTTVKYINESVDIYQTHTFTVDIGFIYKTDFKDLRFGVFLQNFGPNAAARGNYAPFNFRNKTFSPEDFPTPTVFKFGASIVPIKTDLHTITTAIELNHPGDNASNIRFGAEYMYHELLWFRAGYGINASNYAFPTSGVGLRTVIKNQVIHFNYAFAVANALGINHNIGLSVLLNNAKQEKIENENQ